MFNEDYQKQINAELAKKDDFEKILLDKLPEVLDINQKKKKIKNILQSMKNEHKIRVEGKIWKMSK